MQLKTIKYLLLLVSIFTSLTASADVEINATNFPDSYFRNWIFNNVSGASDGTLTNSELAKVTSISCKYKGTHVRGIEYFTALKELTFTRSYSSVLYLDVSRNTALTNLSCSDNQIITLDVNKNTALTNLNCSNNKLTSLDVSNNKALTHLYCNNNQLLCLDLSNNTSLSYASINSQTSYIAALDCSEGIGIPVPSDFDFSKVSNLKLAGNAITGRIANVNGKKYLIFAEAGTQANTIEGKQLTYSYSTGNSKAATMSVSISISKVGEVQQYYVTIYARSYIYDDGPSIYVRDKNGNENYYPVNSEGDGLYVQAGSMVRFIPPQFPASFGISDIFINGAVVGTWRGDNFSYYEECEIDSLACDTEVRFYTRLDSQNSTCYAIAHGPGNVEMYKNGKYIGITSDHVYDYEIISQVFEAGDVMKLVFIPDDYAAFSSLVGSEHGTMYDPGEDLTSKVHNNVYTVDVFWDYDSELIGSDDHPIRSFEAFFVPTLTSSFFPDDNFRSCISSITGVAEGGVISEESLHAITTLDVSNKGIKSLEGIEFFTALEKLYCQNNQLTSLDVLKNMDLTTLDCSHNQLTSLNVGYLWDLNCSSNQLTSLDVSWQTGLEVLRCSSNQLTSLDVSKNTALTSLDCSANWLTSLDVSKNTELTHLDCRSNELKSLDVSKNTALTSLDCSANWLTSLDVSKNTELTHLDCRSNDLKSLDVSKNTALTSLDCTVNWLTSLDVSKNAELTDLKCYDNQLTSLDVSKSTALTLLYCFNNQLISLDVSKNTALIYLQCFSNQLTSLDLSKNPSIKNASIGSQTTSLKAVSTSAGIAIPMPFDFDFTKVSNLKLDGESVLGSVTTVNGQKYLVFAQTGTAQSSIDGKQLTYDYNTGNSFSDAASMDVTVTLSYAPKTYTLSIQSGSGGSVSYDGTTITNTTKSFTVVEGTSATITISPNSGYKLSKLTVNGTNVTSSVKDNQYTISNITANTSVVATFEQITYTLSVQASGMGVISYNNNSIKNATRTYTVNHGASATFTITPDTGYRLASLTVNGTNVTSSVSNGKYTVSNITANTSVVATFEQIPVTNYTLSIQSGSGGSVSYEGTTITNTTKSFTVAEGSSAIVTITPNTGYKLSKLTVNGTNVTSSVKNNQYTINNITANTSVVATFEQITYTLSLQATGNGTVTYNSTSVKNTTRTFTVNHGASTTFIITPDAGYRLASLTVNGTNVTSSVSNGKYTVSNITANTSVVASFEQIPVTTYTLSIQSGSGGSVSYDGTTVTNTTKSFTVTEGSNVTLTITPNDGYRLASLTVNGTNVTSNVSNGKYTVNNITANTSVVATFELIPATTYTLSIQSGSGGSVSYEGTTITNTTKSFTVAEGSYATLTITSNDGYRLASLTVNGTNVTSSVSNGKYTISSITANTSVVATFEEIPATTYTLSIQSGNGGSISYNGTTIADTKTTFTVTEGEDAILVITPDNGYQLVSLTVDGRNVTSEVADGQYTIRDIRSNTSVVASFEQITYMLSVQATGNGSVFVDNIAVKNSTRTFTVGHGTTVVLSFHAEEGCRLSSLSVDGTNVTSGVIDNQYEIANITSDVSVSATFKEIPQAFSQDGINYEIESEKDHTLNVGSGEYSGHVVIPATLTHGDETWTVTGVADGAFDTPAITAITWNPPYAIGSGAFGNLTNPNLLLYVKDAAYAPENVQNVIANGRARKIVLTDAASGNDFDCPKAFTAEEISYTHRYSMTTGIGECRGWETITLPFKVRSITHETKGALVPFKVYRGTHLPFWLYEWSASGFVEASGIEANTPYIISFPNNDYYYSDYLISGNITFSSENVTVISSSEMNVVSGKGNIFIPNYSTLGASIQIYPLNVQNDYCTHKDYYLEGSTFVQELRTVHPFEAYMTTSSNNAKSTIPIFEALPTAIPEIPTNGNYHHNNVRIFNLSGQAVMITNEMSLERALSRLPNGVYIVNGKKVVIK